MVANTAELSAGELGTLSTVFDPQADAMSRDESPEYTLEYIQSELLSLSLRQADVQERIQQVRHALVALVHVFGPEVLAISGKRQQGSSQNLSRSGTKVIDISRRLLSRSTQWLTFNQLLEAIQKESPSTLAGFINPGVSVSNALRTLERHGEVESCPDVGPVKWRWTGNRHLVEIVARTLETNFD